MSELHGKSWCTSHDALGVRHAFRQLQMHNCDAVAGVCLSLAAFTCVDIGAVPYLVADRKGAMQGHREYEP